MSGKKGHSGRRPGTIVWTPTAWCGHHLRLLMEIWLAMHPERRYTVPDKVMRAMARAIRDLFVEWYPHERPPSLAAILTWSRRHRPPGSLRRARPKPISPTSIDNFHFNCREFGEGA
jgi:hypothetical protein